MIKASTFSLECGLFKDLTSKFKLPKDHQQQSLHFLSGDPTFYGHTDLKMAAVGYDIIRASILNPNNHSVPGLVEGDLDARIAVAKHFQGESALLTHADVILTHGANMGLYNILLAVLNAGDNILVPEPGYPFFHLTAKALGVDVRPYQLIAEKSFEIDLERLESQVNERTKFLWVVNPSNPCGSIFSRAHMADIFTFCAKHNLYIVSDEVYWNESFSDFEFVSFGHMSSAAVPVVVLGGLEKTFLVPGWSVSWMLFFDKSNRLAQVKQACLQTAELFEGPCSFMQKALPELLDVLTPNYTKNFMGLFEDNYDYLAAEFTNIDGFKPVPAQGTFYIAVLIDLDHFSEFKSDLEFLQALLTEENVWILNLSAFNGGVHGFRMMTCATKEIYDKLLPRINAFCHRHRSIKSENN